MEQGLVLLHAVVLFIASVIWLIAGIVSKHMNDMDMARIFYLLEGIYLFAAVWRMLSLSAMMPLLLARILCHLFAMIFIGFSLFIVYANNRSKTRKH